MEYIEFLEVIKRYFEDVCEISNVYTGIRLKVRGELSKKEENFLTEVYESLNIPPRLEKDRLLFLNMMLSYLKSKGIIESITDVVIDDEVVRLNIQFNYYRLKEELRK